MARFKFHIFASDGSFTTERHDVRHEPAAKQKAGRIARRTQSAVDLWTLDGRTYITTAMPSKFHTAGYRLERLS